MRKYGVKKWAVKPADGTSGSRRGSVLGPILFVTGVYHLPQRTYSYVYELTAQRCSSLLKDNMIQNINSSKI